MEAAKHFDKQAYDEAVSVLPKYPDLEEPLYIMNVGVLRGKMNLWSKTLPNIRPFYAMKCNPHETVMKAIHNNGWGFDCASKGEVLAAVSMGQDPKNIIFANPCKPVSHIKAAQKAGVTMTTFDSYEEILKIKEHWPEVQALLRVAVDDSGSLCQLSSKFGAPPSVCPALLKQAQEVGINLAGLSFHVGSGSSDTQAFANAVYSVKPIWDEAVASGHDMRLLDIGGGFPGDNDALFQVMATHLSSALETCFPGVQTIAEPGRFFGTACCTLVCPILGKKAPTTDEDKATRYYLADGVYGSFNNVMYDHYSPVPYPIHLIKQDKALAGIKEHSATLFGPTCDSIDRIMDLMMDECEVGDAIVFPNMGAYTFAASCGFNGFETGKIFHFVFEAG